jgi:hypothetical protein
MQSSQWRRPVALVVRVGRKSKEKRVSEIGWIFFAVGAGIFIILLDISTRLIRSNRLLTVILKRMKGRD